MNFKFDGSPFGFGTSPQADWKIIFLGTAALSLIAIAFSTYMFIQIDKGEIFIVERSPIENVQTLNNKKLQETVDYYRGKAEDFELYSNSTTTSVVDPSL